MATATIVKAWYDDRRAYLAVRVVEASGNVEYIGSVARTAEFDALTNAQKRGQLVVAVQTQRDTQQATTSVLSGISGTVTV